MNHTWMKCIGVTALCFALNGISSAAPDSDKDKDKNRKDTFRITHARAAAEPVDPSGPAVYSKVLSINQLGDVLMYCVRYPNLNVPSAYFVFQNTSSSQLSYNVEITYPPIPVGATGILDPGGNSFSFGSFGAGPSPIGPEFQLGGGAPSVIQIASLFTDPDRIATVTVSGYVGNGNVCYGHAQAIVQP